MVDRKGLGDIENASFICPNCGGTHARVAYELEEVEQDSKKLAKILLTFVGFVNKGSVANPLDCLQSMF